MWYKSESGVKPSIEDTASSQVYNYARKNIQEVEREGANGETVKVFVYDEIKIPKDQWYVFKQQQSLQADIDYIGMMTEVM